MEEILVKVILLLIQVTVILLAVSWMNPGMFGPLMASFSLRVIYPLKVRVMLLRIKYLCRMVKIRQRIPRWRMNQLSLLCLIFGLAMILLSVPLWA